MTIVDIRDLSLNQPPITFNKHNKQNKHFVVPNAHACVESGNIHICTADDCPFYRSGGCETEEGSLACPLTGIVLCKADCFGKTWQRHAYESGNMENAQHRLLHSRHESSKGCSQARVRSRQTKRSITAALRVVGTLLPGGEFSKGLHHFTLRRLTKAIVGRCYRHVRSTRRRASTMSSSKLRAPSILNLAHVRAEVCDLMTHYENLGRNWRNTCFGLSISHNLAHCYVNAYANLYLSLLSSAGSSTGFANGPAFERFVIGMLYISQAGYVSSDRVVVCQDKFLATALPSLADIVRYSDRLPNCKIHPRLSLRNTTRFMHDVKRSLASPWCNVHHFKVDYGDALRGTATLTILDPEVVES